MIISINPEAPQKNLIRKVVEILRNGGIIGYPTDTTYGIGCDIFNKEAMDKIFTLKKRDKNKPLSFVCPELSWISRYAVVTPCILTIIKRFLPGPYTFILKSRRDFQLYRTVGVRVPDDKISTAIAHNLGSPISSTSANISGESVISTPSEIMNKIGDQLDLIIDSGIMSSEPSSVIDLSEDRPVVLRKGKGDVSCFIG